jgi:hypothetical protein
MLRGTLAAGDRELRRFTTRFTTRLGKPPRCCPGRTAPAPSSTR